MLIGTDTLTLKKTDVEVVHISSLGLWLFADGAEFFVDFNDYPDLLKANIQQLSGVTTDMLGNFHWKELDVVLSEKL